MKEKTFEEIKLGDVIRLRPDACHNDATVYKKTEKTMFVRRPYIHADDVEYSGHSIITYIGLEDFEFYPHTSEKFLVIQDGPMLR